jgi:8-oxo-dGTP pyrophosphatase MutT (NUDIX family)
MADKPAPITRIDSHLAWECPWYSIRQDRIRLPDGGEGVYNVLQMQHSVWTVPVTPSGDIVLIHNYRYTLGEWCWELPAGHIEDNLTPMEAARQELLEEAGGQSADWTLILKLSTLNGIGSHYGYFFLARNVTLGPPQHERTEAITVHTFPAKTVFDMARTGQINDAVSVTALLLAEPLL